MTKTRILLADDHAVLRQGMKRLIEAEPDLEVVGEAADGSHVLALVALLKPDVVVLDLSMTEMGGAETMRQLKEKNASSKVLILTVHEDQNYLREGLSAGALGYILKRAAADELIRAIRATAQGMVYIDPRIAIKLFNRGADDKRPQPESDSPELTQRELDVLRHIAEGFSNKEIAAMLKTSIKTIESYKARGMEKLGISSRVDIVRIARQRHWEPVE